MRRVVADTTPLNYLVLIGHDGLLPILFDGVLVPTDVMNELRHQDAPTVVRTWATSPPSWVEVVAWTAQLSDPPLDRLDSGERAAIELAKHVHADLVLMDDRDGVAIARGRGFAVTGTLGILDLAARRGLVSLDTALERLQATNFRCKPQVVAALLANQKL